MDDGVVHLVGPDVTVDGHLRRQRCSWCGTLLEEMDLAQVAWMLNPDGSDPGPPPPWPTGEFVQVTGGSDLGFTGRRIIESEDGRFPDNACMALDPQVTS